MNKDWVVQVVDLQGVVVRSIACPSECAAERTERGVLVNLDHGRYYTRIERLQTEEAKP